MTYTTKKSINNKEYTYLVKSIRMPDGSIKKIQKILHDEKEPQEKYTNYFLDKEKQLYENYALKKYETGAVFSEKTIRIIEGLRVDYNHLIKTLTQPQLKDLFDRFTVNFTYESNAIEGNSLTLKDVDIVISENAVVEGKSLREIYETRNSREAVDMLFKKKLRVDERGMVKLHSTLVRDIDTPTGFKKVPNFLLGRAVETTPPEKVKAAIGELLKWYEDGLERIHPLQLASLFHGRFERIHPFEDGNGRTGRILANAILVNNGYPPLIIRKTQRVSYLKCLSNFDNGFHANLERFFLEKYKETFRKFFSIYVKYL